MAGMFIVLVVGFVYLLLYQKNIAARLDALQGVATEKPNPVQNITGGAPSKNFQPVVSGNTIVGVATSTPKSGFVPKTGPQTPIGAANPDIQSEVNKILDNK